MPCFGRIFGQKVSVTNLHFGFLSNQPFLKSMYPKIYVSYFCRKIIFCPTLGGSRPRLGQSSRGVNGREKGEWTEEEDERGKDDGKASGNNYE